MPDGAYILQQEYIDTCPMCSLDMYGLTWNLYFMKDLEPQRPHHPHVKPYSIDF